MAHLPQPLDELRTALRAMATPEKAKTSSWFFKTGPGQYGEGDQFLGVTVPEQRKIAKQFKALPLDEIHKLLSSPWHEERLTALFILVSQYKSGTQSEKQKIYEFYLSHAGPVGFGLVWGLRKIPPGIFWGVNNWDLVDSSAEYIVGSWLQDKSEKLTVLQKLANSDLIWEKRIAMIATFHYIRAGRADEALVIAELLLDDPHDLLQKAVGWMLREVGKRVDRELLLDFLDQHAATMPRTTLRYAIEHLETSLRVHYLDKRVAKS